MHCPRVEFVFWQAFEVVIGDAKTFLAGDLRLPTQNVAGFCDVGLPLFGIINGQVFVDHFLVGTRQADDLLGKLANCISDGLPMLTRYG